MKDNSIYEATQHNMEVNSMLSLKAQMRKAERCKSIKAFILVLPLLLFVGITFIMPLSDVLTRSIDNPIIFESMPKTLKSLEKWDGIELPSEETFEIFATELLALKENHKIGKAASRLNREMSGLRSLLTQSARKLERLGPNATRSDVINIDPRWKDKDVWSTIKRTGERYTLGYYLTALDLEYASDGKVRMLPEDRRLYLGLFAQTFLVTALITILCLALGYPLAFLLAALPTRISNLLMILVLLPFWTSLLVRTTSWIVMLQSEGVINKILLWLGIIETPIAMIYNQTGTVIAMTHIMLPFMILPIYSVMKNVDSNYMRAAESMGASKAYAFVRVYLPQTLPGIGAGAILVFILSIGYYITPALVGGRSGQVISNFIAYHMQTSLNWGLAGALGSILLVVVLGLYWVYSRMVGINNMKLG